VYVVATAGHVDHGKSTLVRALTGMEPDRWAEERRRGMTIDLGYAWMTLARGEQLAFVDVPGHQRFIGNMLAGIGPAPAVLFVVAADEGWRRQSGEHLAAVDALGLTHGLLVVTRSDLADPGPATDEALRRLAGSSLGAVEAVAVSGQTGAGLPELQAALGRLVAGLPQPDPSARVRLWVDRAFTVRGSGTVVTGTLGAGRVGVGDELVLGGRSVTVRSVQSLGQPHDQVEAVARVALNLRGVPLDGVDRGGVLLTPGAWFETTIADVRVQVPADELPTQLILHVGSAHLPVRIRPLGLDTARLTLPRALPLQAGDRAILRDPGRQEILTGVLVLDPDPPELRRRGAAAARALELDALTGTAQLRVEVARRGAVRADHVTRLGVRVDERPDGVHVESGWLIDDGRWQQWVEAAPPVADQHAAANALEPAVPVDVFRRRLGLPDAALVAPVARAAGLTVGAKGVARAGARPSFGPAEAALRELEMQLEQNPFAAPERVELDRLRLGVRELAAAERVGRLVRLADGVVLLPSAIDAAVARLRALPQPFTTSDARQALGTTRRVVIPLLEHLDGAGRTRRQPDSSRLVTD
jgi:selenocysteine-specific elongation factor